MKWLNCGKIRLSLFMVAILLCGGNAKADFTFGTPLNMGPTLNSSAIDECQFSSSDGLELYFESDRPGGYGTSDYSRGIYGSFDPELKRQQITGLVHTSKLDAEIWDEFNSDWNRLVLEAERLRVELGGKVEQEIESDKDFSVPKGASEREIVRKTRIHQSFFREAILSSYEDTCCITGLRIKECLVASHIIPWSISEQHRTDPCNGLCLSATFDRLFDRGLITVRNDLDVYISERLRKAGDRRVDEIICKYHGTPIFRPRRFLPLQAHLEWHRNNVFQD